MPHALPDQRVSALAMTPQQFQTLGHALVDRIATFLDTLPNRPVTTGESPSAIRAALESAGVIFVEENGEGPGVRLRKATK